MIEHIVLIKFKDKLEEAQVDELIKRTLNSKDKIPGIIDIQQGRNFSNRSQGYEIGLTVRFTDRNALENYGPHPEHQKIVSYLQELGVEDLIVVDFET
jgi:hypothetical protein